VWSFVSRSNGAQSYRVLVQSNNFQPDYLDLRIENFLADCKKILESLTEEQFEEFQTSLISEKLEKDKTLGQETSRYWNEISNERYVFDRAQREAEAIAELTQGELIEFYNRYISPTSNDRRKVSVQIWIPKDLHELENPQPKNSTEDPTPINSEENSAPKNSNENPATSGENQPSAGENGISSGHAGTSEQNPAPPKENPVTAEENPSTAQENLVTPKENPAEIPATVEENPTTPHESPANPKENHTNSEGNPANPKEKSATPNETPAENPATGEQKASRSTLPEMAKPIVIRDYVEWKRRQALLPLPIPGAL